MPSMSKGQQAAYQRYWGVIRWSASAHVTTADMWSAIRDEASRLGLSSPGVSAKDVQVLRGWATAMQTTLEQAANANPELGVTELNIAEAPWARSLNEQGALPLLQVSAPVTILSPDGTTVETYLTTEIPDFGSMSIADLTSRAQFNYSMIAQTANAKKTYSGTVVDVGDLQIVRI